MLNVLLQSDAEQLENLMLPDSVQKARFAEAVRQLSSMDMDDVWRQIMEWMV